MPAMAAITINDGKATPVAHTFNPMTFDQSMGLATLADRSGGIAIGYPTVNLQLVNPAKPTVNGRAVSGSDRVYRAKIRFSLPVMEALSVADSGYTPAPTVAYTLRGNVEFILPERCTLADRKDLLAYVKNGLAQSVVTSLAQDLEALW